jgi:hypothetical protein
MPWFRLVVADSTVRGTLQAPVGTGGNPIIKSRAAAWPMPIQSKVIQ